MPYAQLMLFGRSINAGTDKIMFSVFRVAVIGSNRKLLGRVVMEAGKLMEHRDNNPGKGKSCCLSSNIWCAGLCLFPY